MPVATALPAAKIRKKLPAVTPPQARESNEECENSKSMSGNSRMHSGIMPANETQTSRSQVGKEYSELQHSGEQIAQEVAQIGHQNTQEFAQFDQQYPQTVTQFGQQGAQGSGEAYGHGQQFPQSRPHSYQQFLHDGTQFGQPMLQFGQQGAQGSGDLYSHGQQFSQSGQQYYQQFSHYGTQFGQTMPQFGQHGAVQGSGAVYSHGQQFPQSRPQSYQQFLHDGTQFGPHQPPPFPSYQDQSPQRAIDISSNIHRATAFRHRKAREEDQKAAQEGKTVKTRYMRRSEGKHCGKCEAELTPYQLIRRN